MRRKIIALNVLFTVLSTSLFSQISDAIIKINNENHEYGSGQNNNYMESTTIYRRIKINSEYARKQFNTLYIPTYEDLNFKFILVSLEASTIKKDGTTYKVHNDRIKETTLPANVPFLYGYDGKVKMLAFENLEVGDEIEYQYRVNYLSNTSYNYLNFIRTKFVSQQYPIESAEYIFLVKNGLQFSGYPKNLNATFTESEIGRNEIIYSLKLNNLIENKNDPFSSAYDFPFFYYRIYNKPNYNPVESWNDFVDNITFKTKKKESLFGGKTILDIQKVAKEKNGAISKVNCIKEQILENVTSDVSNLLAQYEYFEPDLQEAKQLLHLFDLLGIKSSLILVKSKFDGDIIDEFITVEQFDNFLIEFSDKQGNIYYMYFFTPFYEINEIPYRYQGTKALKVERIDDSYKFSFMKVPEQNYSSNSSTIEYNYMLDEIDSVLRFDVTKKVYLTGAFCQSASPLYMIEKLDTTESLNYFSKEIKDDLNNNFFGISIDTIIHGQYNGEINYTVEYEMTKRNYNPTNMLSFEVGDFNELGSLLGTLEKVERTSDAHFKFPYSKKITLKIETNEAYSFVNNTLLDFEESNNIAYIKSKHNLLNNILEINIEFSLLKSFCTKNEWNSFVMINQALEDYLKSKIVLTKTM